MSAKHGQTPAAWTGVIVTMVGFIIGSVGFLLGPNWLVIWIGAGVVAAGAIAGWAMSVAGLGERPRKLSRQ